MTSIRLILDTDPGVDDAMAIAYALAHPDIELVALTTVFGNAGIELTTRNAQYVLDRLGAETVAVARGAAAPLAWPGLPAPDFVHGADGLGNVYPGSTPSQAAGEAAPLRQEAAHAQLSELDAADYIIAAAKAAPGELVLAAIGPLTNIAEALRREPSLPELVRSLVIMGGSVIEPGNVSPLAEANFLNDPHAADEVLACDWPLTVVGLDVTHQVMLYDSDLERLRNEAGETGRLIWDSSRFYVNFYSEQGATAAEVAGGGERGCAMHDASALVYAMIPDAFEVQQGEARVITKGVAAGQLAFNRMPYTHYALPYWNDRPRVGVCLGVDARRVHEDYLQTVLRGHLT